jgi:hypothetical protein
MPVSRVKANTTPHPLPPLPPLPPHFILCHSPGRKSGAESGPQVIPRTRTLFAPPRSVCDTRCRSCPSFRRSCRSRKAQRSRAVPVTRHASQVVNASDWDRRNGVTAPPSSGKQILRRALPLCQCPSPEHFQTYPSLCGSSCARLLLCSPALACTHAPAAPAILSPISDSTRRLPLLPRIHASASLALLSNLHQSHSSTRTPSCCSKPCTA